MGKIINIKNDFSPFPGGRFNKDGPFSGERFLKEFLIPALQENDTVVIELDGTFGYGSSFLEEVFGGLIRAEKFTEEEINSKLNIKTDDFVVKTEVNLYIEEALVEQKSAQKEADN